MGLLARLCIVLEHLMAIYRALGTKYKLSGSSGDWCGIAWNPVEEESGERDTVVESKDGSLTAIPGRFLGSLF